MKNLDGLTINYSISWNTITITNFNKLYVENDSIVFTVTNVVNPSIASTTSSFQINLFDSLGNSIEKQFDSLNYTTEPGQIANISVNFSNIYFDGYSNCTISFDRQNSLNTLGTNVTC